MGLFDLLRRRTTGTAASQASASPAPSAVDHAVGLHQAGRIVEAETLYRALLAREPDHAEARHLLGVALHQRGEQDAALAAIDAAIALEPGVAVFHFNRGNVQNALGKGRAAAESYARATAINPAHVASWLNLGRTLLRLGDHAAALPALRHAFALDPEAPALRFELATVLVTLADARGGKPLYAEAANLLEGHWQDAEHARGARLMLAHALAESGSVSRAAEHFAAALHSADGLDRAMLIRAHASLANCYNRLGRTREAASQYRAALALDPTQSAGASALVTCLAYEADCTPPMLLEAHRAWESSLSGARERVPTAAPAVADRDPERRLRVGYLSPDFRRHPVAALLAPALERHDRDAVEVFGYYNFAGTDAYTARLRNACAHWREVAHLDDDALDRLIRADRIDILVDLAGHTYLNRLAVLARKPAPVLAEWLGYYCTTGLAAVDWFITDPWSSPPGQEAWFSEKLHRLPHTRFCYEPYAFVPEVNALPAKERGHLTFGSLNNLAKLNPAVLLLWARVLGEVPGAHLVIQGQALDDEPNRRRFAALAAECGLPMERLELRGFTTLEEATRAYHGIDIALDPFPFSGGMTSFEALWMGVPVVTLEQPLVHGRQSLSMLHNLGLPELVARDADDYVAIARRLAEDTRRLAELRSGLRPRFAASPLMDYAAFAQHLDAAYRHFWRAHLAAA
jgi:predicted O-linked N-acetylglucosamine transferase (SPINDLY family)